MAFIGNQPFTAAFLTDTFSGTGSQTAYTMTVAPANTSSIIVAVTGVLQDPSTYSVSGTTLTFSAAPPSGTSNISVRYLGIPASGVTTTAYRTVTDFTATAAQTSFSVPSYTVGYIDVYRNGVRLVSTDFTATTGTTVVLVNACTSGDSVVTESFLVSSVLNAIPNSPASVGTSNIVSGVTLTSPTLTSPTISGAVVSSMNSSVITSGTAVASTSGTSIDFTSLPTWVKRITVMLRGVSTNSTSLWLLQLGTSSGVTTSGYLGLVSNISGSVSSAYSAGFTLVTDSANGNIYHGLIQIVTLGSNNFVINGILSRSDAANQYTSAGSIALGGVLDRVRITTVNGTDTFDAGSINILYE